MIALRAAPSPCVKTRRSRRLARAEHPHSACPRVFSRRYSRSSWRASSTKRFASSSVSPWELAPGTSATFAEYPPSSAGSKTRVTRSISLPLYVSEARIDRLTPKSTGQGFSALLPIEPPRKILQNCPATIGVKRTSCSTDTSRAALPRGSETEDRRKEHDVVAPVGPGPAA